MILDNTKDMELELEGSELVAKDELVVEEGHVLEPRKVSDIRGF